MKFKHTFNVFIDNFAVTYKQLLYRLITGLIAGLLSFAIIYPVINGLIDSESFTSLVEGLKDFVANLAGGHVEELQGISEKIEEAFNNFMTLLGTKTAQMILSGLLVTVVYIVEKWFAGVGNYTTASIINDKMAFRQESKFIATLISTLPKSSIYNLIYVPLSICYDLIVTVVMFMIIFILLNSVLSSFFLIEIVLFISVVLFSIAVKMTFTADWLPSLIRGKMTQRAAFKYTFDHSNKPFLPVLSNFIVLVLLVLGVNVAAAICTFGAGLLITVPASYNVLICFEFVNYYDREEIKYFVDKNNIIRPAQEHAPTREEFFRGEDD